MKAGRTYRADRQTRRKEADKMEARKILVIDDEPSFVEALRKTLESHFFEVCTAQSGEQCKEMLKKEPQAIVLCNIRPRGEAFKLHRWIKQHPRYREIPLFVIDSPPEKAISEGWRRDQGLLMEAEDYDTKPVEPSVLLPRLEMLVEKTSKRIKVLTVDDHTMVRDGLVAVLSLQKDIELVGEAVNGMEAIEKAVRLHPNVVLMDIMMPGMNGLEATRRILKELPDIKVLILTQYDDEENVVVAKNAGASGFIPKKAASAELLSGIRSVSEGNYYPENFASMELH